MYSINSLHCSHLFIAHKPWSTTDEVRQSEEADSVGVVVVVVVII